MGDIRYKLLIAEDEVNILRGIEKYISAHTQVFDKIYCARNGSEAIDMILRYHPDVMLMDVQMPVKTGLEVMRDAIAAGVCPKTIILSGFDTFSYAQQALRLGAVDYLIKPCRSSEILQKLEKIVSGPQDHVENLSKAEESHLFITAVEYCKEHMSEHLTLSQVAEKVKVSPTYLSILFSQNRGGFVDYINKLRVDCACGYMNDDTLKIYEIAYKVGFSDEKYFSKVFKKVTGHSPSSYRQALNNGSSDHKPK